MISSVLSAEYHFGGGGGGSFLAFTVTGYLQLIENEHFTPAFERIINVPMRKLGETVSCVPSPTLSPQ